MSLAYLRHLLTHPEDNPLRPVGVHWAGLPLGVKSRRLRQRGLGAMLGSLVSAHGVEQAGLGTCATVLRLGPVVVTFGLDERADTQARRVVRRVADAYQANVDCANRALGVVQAERDRLKTENAELKASMGVARAMGHRGLA